MFQVYEFLLKKGLERRRVQEEFFQIVLSAIQEGNCSVKIIQAPTGTGKTYGYLIPLMESEQKAIISTGTKLLQEQLRKDIENLRAYYSYIHGKEINYLIMKGKTNYLCLDRYHNLPPESVPSELYMSVQGNWDGDFEFVNIDHELKEKLCVDEDYCTPSYRKMCKYFQECYYWSRLKNLEKSADIVVVNHALLSLKEFENSDERVLVIDEAHELDKYVTSSLTSGVSVYTLRVEIVGKVLEFIRNANVEVEDFFVRNFEKLFNAGQEEVAVESLKPYAKDFEESILRPLFQYHKAIRESLISELTRFTTERMFVSMQFKEYLLKSGLLDWERYLDLKSNYEEPSEEERKFIKKLKDYELLTKRLQRVKEFHRLIMEEPQDFGYLVGRKYSKKLNTFNYWLHTFPIFPSGYVDFSNYKSIVITSATVDPEDLRQTFAIQGEYYELEHTFPYHKVNFVVYKVDPRDVKRWEECVKMAYAYLRSLHDKVLVLLTNKEHKKLFEKEDGVAFQGEGNLSQLLKALSEGKLKAVIGLDSLWFGVDVKGHKGILMSKLPFENPNEPVNFHRIRFLKSMGLEPFEYQKRKALIKFRQGIGRLMRSKDDGGTIVLCDGRVSKFREFIRAVEDLGIRVTYKKLD
ncbi:MAG: ATP-dependent DNA helicase [Aquificaceae bacterium]|nr:ATP-dependent DNA helicase [Aquificaceae bacterium]MCX8075874.1 ATP-dependent DNA helicase [Aquificaceae bacterium]MDW8095989.1 ATP-dependent DNA helicase [Aquificaceae bacterium]